MTLILAAELPDWLAALPTINASLNGLATILLVLGFLLIKQGKRDAHRNVMLTYYTSQCEGRLAAVVPILAIITIYRGLKADWDRHRKIAKVTFPIWLYVSITGVVIYLMLYHLPLE